MECIRDQSLVYEILLWNKDPVIFTSDDAFGRIATATGATWKLYGKNFTAQYVSAPDHASWDITEEVTVEVWIRPTSVAAAIGIFSRGNTTTISNNPYYMRMGGDTLPYFTIGSGAANDSTGGGNALAANKWFHLVGIAAVSNLYLIQNGVLVRSAARTLNPTTTNTVSLVGAGDTTPLVPLTGDIGEARVYNRALSFLEACRNFETTKGRYI